MTLKKIISQDAIDRRNHWVEEIVQIGEHFGQDVERVEAELQEEVRANGTQALKDHLRLCGEIPESYGHDSSGEKLYSKYTDVLLAETFAAIGFRSLVLTERGDAADVEVFGPDYEFVADAKAFRLSRTAKNQKDFKIAAMDNWKRGKPFATVVCPMYQLPSRSSQIYQDASARNVAVLSYSHCSILIGLAEEKTAEKAIQLLGEVFRAVRELPPVKDAITYWTAVNRTMHDFDPACEKLWLKEKSAMLEAIQIAKEAGLQFLADERARIMRLSHKEALDAILEIRKIGSREETIRSVGDGGLMLHR